MKQLYNRNNIIWLVLSFLFISINNDLRAQTNEKTKNQRASYLSKKYKITSLESTDLIQSMDESTQMMNKIFHDSTLTSAEKIRRIETLEKLRAAKVRNIIPDKNRRLFPIDIQRRKISN